MLLDIHQDRDLEFDSIVYILKESLGFLLRQGKEIRCDAIDMRSLGVLEVCEQVQDAFTVWQDDL